MTNENEDGKNDKNDQNDKNGKTVDDNINKIRF